MKIRLKIRWHHTVTSGNKIWERNRVESYCALPVSAVLASSLWDGVEVNKVIMRTNSQQASICAEREKEGHAGTCSSTLSMLSWKQFVNFVMWVFFTHRQRNASLTAARSRQCGSPPGLWSLHPERTTWETQGSPLDHDAPGDLQTTNYSWWAALCTDECRSVKDLYWLSRVRSYGNHSSAGMEVCTVSMFLRERQSCQSPVNHLSINQSITCL